MIINKIKTNINVKQSVVLLFLLMIPQIAFCDDLQNAINRDYFRTPEASAFKKYGEESVNEYTGTADIPVPLYTIKCKDVEIPLVLRYDASGIKVEQEASWVGLGWNLMVGGCINYVCAGGHDMYGAPEVPMDLWTEQLTSDIVWSKSAIMNYEHDWHYSKSQTRYYKYKANETSNWMGKYPLQPQNFIHRYEDMYDVSGMGAYIDWGWGERDFYSVNVMGKSFMFFIDPATLKVFKIGKSGEDFTVNLEYPSTYPPKGIGKQPDVKNWKITDSDGYIYHFEVSDTYLYETKTGMKYTSCWYLTKIETPMRETVELRYESFTKQSRDIKVESYRLPFVHEGGNACCSNVSQATYTNYRQCENSGMKVTGHYLKEIETSNQTVTFTISNSSASSGKKLDAITVKSKLGNKPEIKSIKFAYSTFGYSNVGGNTVPASDSNAELRLKLDNVKEITSAETLTTSFAYNSLKLPSKRSCAQDYWGYYNGKENKVPGRGYSLIPTPSPFMSAFYIKALSDHSFLKEGADRSSNINYMQAAVLNKVVYPTGGYTTYEYETNTCATNSLSEAGIPYDVGIIKYYTYTPDVPAGTNTVSNEPYNFTLTESLDYTLEVKCNGDAINGSSISIIIVSMTLAGSPILYPLVYQNLNDYITVEQGTLPAGAYQLLIGAPSVGNKGYGISCKLTGYYKSTTSSHTYNKAVGGLRIAKISNFDHNSTPINYTTYSYDNNGKTSGQLLSKIETIDHVYCFNTTPQGGSHGSHFVDVYTVTPGHPRLPAFYASCNPGIVGYSKVTKSKYNANGSLEKRVVTSYKNNSPQMMQGIDYYTCFDNGLVESQEIYTASSSNPVSKTVNTYDYDIDDHYTTNIIAKKIDIGADQGTTGYDVHYSIYDAPNINPTLEGDTHTHGSSYDVLRYPYILSRVELASTTTTEYGPSNSTVVKTKNYLYNPINHQVSQIDEKASLPNQFRRTKITYSADGTDNISKSMKNAHRLNDVVENKVFLVENNSEKNCISTQHTYYDTFNSSSCYLPKSYATSIGSNALETRAKYSYDKKGNVCSIEVDGIETVYIWSYNGHYPVAQIEGLTLAKVKTAIGESTINSLLSKEEPSASDISTMRTKINAAGGHITTYTYNPLVGMTSQTLPNGHKTTYDYKNGRLEKVSDSQGVIQKYQYNFIK